MIGHAKKYLIYTFVSSWAFWGTAVALSQFHISRYGMMLTMIPLVLGELMPATIAILLKKKDSPAAFKAFTSNILNIKHHLLWYACVIMMAFLNAFLPFLFHGATQQNPLYVVLLAFPIMIVGGGLEEIGWRGLLLPAFQKRIPDFYSTLIIGIIWSVWHLPLFFVAGTSQSHTSFLYFSILIIAIAFLLTTIYTATKSIFLCIVLHAFINSFWSVYAPNGKLFSSIPAVIFGIVVFLLFEILKQRNRFVVN